MGIRAALAMVALAIASGVAAGGPDPVLNPGFATSLEGWTVLFGRPVVWSVLDAQGAPDSGSARITNDMAPSNGATPLALRQCLPASGGTGYLFAVEVFLPAGEPPSTLGHLVVYGHDDTDCGPGITAMEGLFAFGSFDTWIPVAGALSLPQGTYSLSLSLGVRKEAGVSAPASAHFDQVQLVLDRIFRDSFDRTKF